MENFDKAYLDIDEIAKKIEQRIKELEEQEKKQKEEKVYQDENTGGKIADIDEIIKEIDRRIAELEAEEEKEQEQKLDLEDLTDKVNQKLDALDAVQDEDLDKTLYDLTEISKTINETIKSLEAKRKLRKQQKAKYCDLARKKNTKKVVAKKKDKK